MDEGIARNIEIPLAWVGVEELPILQVNQFLGQSDPQGEFFVTLGQMTMPPLLGTPEQQATQIQQIAYVPIKPIARLGFTRQRLEEFIGILQQTLVNYDQAQETGRSGGL